MNDKKILIIANERNYTVAAFQNNPVDIVFGYREIGIFNKVLRRLHHDSHVGAFSIWYELSACDLASYDMIILFECTYALRMIEYIRRHNSKCRLIYWLWNSVNKQGKRFGYSATKETMRIIGMSHNCHNAVEVWSFDKLDCTNYGIRYNNQVGYVLPDYLGAEVKNDVFFCGKDKGRLKKLLEVSSLFVKCDISFKFMVLPDNNKYREEHRKYLIKSPLPYSSLVHYECSSRCLLDLTQEGQGGITWRPLEAMFYKKKLITNFQDIVNYDFFNHNNIFVLGRDDINNLCDFVRAPYENIEQSIIDRYLLKGWLTHF